MVSSAVNHTESQSPVDDKDTASNATASMVSTELHSQLNELSLEAQPSYEPEAVCVLPDQEPVASTARPQLGIDASGSDPVPPVIDVTTEVNEAKSLSVEELLQQLSDAKQAQAEAKQAQALAEKHMLEAQSDATNARAIFECSVCLDSLCDTVLLPCMHLFCSDCVDKLVECPQCRRPVTGQSRVYLA